MANIQKTEIVIYSKELANILKSKGFHLIRTEINFKDSKYFVFVFEYNPLIEDFIKNFKHR